MPAIQDPDITKSNGQISWTHKSTDSYLATGKDTNGKRFRISSTNYNYIIRINLYNGSIWLIRNGNRIRLRRVTN